MAVSIVHLSDFHFADDNNPIIGKLPALAAAIRAADPTCRDYVIVLSGDVADHGTEPQYSLATSFLLQLTAAITKDRPGATVRYLSVPGNHDCYLPESEVTLRSILVDGIRASINSPAPDPSILQSLMDRQTSYFAFCRDLNIPTTNQDGLYGCHTFDFGLHRIRFNLYNTAFASMLREQRGTLLIPLATVRSSVKNDADVGQSVSVFHHPYPWFDTETDIAFRNHIEHTSDIVLTGHQHFDHAYHKQTLTNDFILYSEGDVLQEPSKSETSGFRIILLNFDNSLRRVISYSWAGSSYLKTNDSDWQPYVRTAGLATSLMPTSEFIRHLSDSGIGLTHRSKGLLPLDAVYVFPDITTSTFSASNVSKDVKGENLLAYLAKTPKLVIRGSAYSGKTSLAKVIVKEWLRSRALFPILISGREISQADQSYVERLVRNAAEAAYGSENGERYLQLPIDKKSLVIDDWDDSRLTDIERDKFLNNANSYFGHVVLFVQGISYVHYVLAKIKGSEAILEFEFASIRELSHVARGQLIDKWLSLDLAVDSEQFSRRVEETERLIQNIIGKNTLPSLPLIVLAILEASERKQDILPENGSFGYLYEVLITTALNSTIGTKPQLDKKYAFLSILAFRLFESSSEVIGESDVNQLIDDYARSFKINIDKDSLMKDLERARVLIKQNGNVSFGYTHYFYYFLALYFKNHLGDAEGASLRKTLLDIAGGVNSSTNRTFLMFVIYLTHDAELMNALLAMSKVVLSEFAPSDFTQEVEFYNSKDFAGVDRHAPETVDLEASRRRRREIADISKRQQTPEQESSFAFLTDGHAYSDALPLSTKLEYAMSCIEMLGQVLRNFTGSLPGDRKMAILETTYALGLRSLRAMLTTLGMATLQVNEGIAKRDTSKPEDRQLIKQVQKLLTILGQIVGGAMIHAVSLNVGSADIDDSAYAETLDKVGRNDATEMIDLAIKLDHSTEYPYTRIKKLHKQYASNRFAQRVLRDLVIENMHVFKVEREMRQRVLNILRAGPADSAVLSQSAKRLK